eukprot:TRINITY_DN310_c0_g1_i10.p1 TRINITY_DN310_c0_g1~~TRINITY_DN310_c0_g1_i10.p1  ORF type:complete len:334 (+),score=34.55 TRINITY_DN310_c0_g1_i10:503-1504(+)
MELSSSCLSTEIRSLDLLLPRNGLRKSKSVSSAELWQRHEAATALPPRRGRKSFSGTTRASSSANEKTAHVKQSNGHAVNVRPFECEDSGVRVLEHMSALVRVTYGIGIYGVMALAGKAICCVTGVDSFGGLELCTDAMLNGLGYAVPPMMALLFILDDEVVKLCPYARAIRDVEDEELINFFLGMSPWQFMLIVTASSVGEELFYRVAVQGGLSHVFLSDTWHKDIHGIASLTGIFPTFAPFAQGFAAVITAALTGSLYFTAASPKGTTNTLSCKNTKDVKDLANFFHIPMYMRGKRISRLCCVSTHLQLTIICRLSLNSTERINAFGFNQA